MFTKKINGCVWHQSFLADDTIIYKDVVEYAIPECNSCV